MNVGMSKTRSIGVLILFSAIVLSGAVLLASALAVPPANKFSGEVTLNDTDAPTGTIIDAFIDGDLRGSTEVKSPGEYEYLSVNGSASDDGKTVTFKVCGATAEQTGTWTVWIEHVQKLDLTAGGAPAGDTDTTRPTITITEPESDVSFTIANIMVNGTVSDENLDKVQVKVVPPGNWMGATIDGTTWSIPVTLGLGKHTIHAIAYDTSENSREVQVYNVSYVIGGSEDTTPPTVSIKSPSDGDAFTTTTITIRGTASDNKGVHEVRVNVGGDWMVANGTTEWSRIVTLSLGLHTIKVIAVDDAGLHSKPVSITVARNPPSSGGIVIATRATPTGTDTQPVSENATSATSTSTITETNTSVTTSTKDPATKPETKGLPGFEAMSAIAGLLAVAYMLTRR